MTDLHDILTCLDTPVITGDAHRVVTGISDDSRQIQEGHVYVAIPGVNSNLNGRDHIPAAIENGASVIVAESAPDADCPHQLTWVHVKNARLALAKLACQYHDHPAERLRVIGVTGTNGKTTTTFLIHHIMQSVWHRSGLLGTIKFDDGEKSVTATHTTPGASALQQLFATMRDNGCRGVAMEVSSHGLEQHRVSSVPFDTAVFTNLTQDHLDYHGTMQAYYEAKRTLFELTANSHKAKPTAIINTDDPAGERLTRDLPANLRIWSYGMNAHADFKILNITQQFRGTTFQLDVQEKSYLVRIPFIGIFNAYNIVAAIASCSAVGIKVRDAIKALAEAPQVPGRMEHVGTKSGVNVYVDYAHTPDALANACSTIRKLEPKRLITVFGCGGDRDTAKRPLMAEAASANSDYCVITSDNPRSEDPQSIIKMVEKGIKGCPSVSIIDRKEAIKTAIEFASGGDVVLIAGKGHETYQQFADKTISFDDREVARNILKTLRVSELIARQQELAEREKERANRPVNDEWKKRPKWAIRPEDRDSIDDTPPQRNKPKDQ